MSLDNIILLYMFDILTYEYLGSRPAQILNGKPILECACATPVAPPECKENEIQVWDPDTQTWSVHPDHRPKFNNDGTMVAGTSYWMPEDDWATPARYMTAFGDFPSGALFEAPQKPTPTVEELILRCRQIRKVLLDKTDRFLMIDTSLDTPCQDAVIAFRKSLRDDVPLMDGYPWDGDGDIAKSKLPEVPDCIKESIYK